MSDNHGAGVADIIWYRPDGTTMSDEDWQSGFAKSLGVFLNGDAILAPDPQGRRIRDDTFLLLFNAGADPIEFRLKNAIRPGEYHPFSTAWNEGREPRPEIIHTVGLEQCVVQGRAAIGWDDKYGNEEWHNRISGDRDQGTVQYTVLGTPCAVQS